MASCSNSIEAFTGQNAELNVSDKYIQLMEDSLGEGSLYERVKDTYFELFKDLNISEEEKIQLVANNIANLATNITAQAMNTAIMWAKEERDGVYQLAQIKAQTELTLAQKELTSEEICKTVAEGELVAAQKAEVLAATIRTDELNAAQIKSTEATIYSTLAESYRKSGKVVISTDTDNVLKGTSGDLAGYTYKQDKFIDRQIISFEDSKRNHAANSSAQLIGQLLSAEIPIEETDTAFLLWKSSMEYLNQDS